jgi:hypothetical protein
MPRAFVFVFASAALLAAHASAAGANSFGPAKASVSQPNGGIVVLARVKCGFDENGEFSCKRVRKNDRRHRDEDDGHSSDQGSSEPSNNTNNPPPAQGPKPSAGQCFTVETTKVGTIECGADFPARSCGAVENGMITCCCAK